MRKKMFFCLVLIVLCASLSAQSPRLEIIGTDTFAVLPISQLRVVNARYVELKGCREEKDSITAQVIDQTVANNNLKASILQLKEANRINGLIIKEKDIVIGIYNKELENAAKKRKQLKLQRNTLAGGILIFAVKLLLF